MRLEEGARAVGTVEVCLVGDELVSWKTEGRGGMREVREAKDMAVRGCRTWKKEIEEIYGK